MLAIRALSKTFGDITVLKNVNLDVERGEIHALVGHNGSGKSTLVKILAGYYRPDAGAEAELDGTPLKLGSAAEGRARGLAFVHQDLGLIDGLSVMDNLALSGGYELWNRAAISWRRQAVRTRAALERLGYDIDPTRRVAELSISEKVGLAAARAIGPVDEPPPAVLVLDEATAALPRLEVERLGACLQALIAAGVGVLYISHRLDEVLAWSSRVSVLRDGRKVDTLAAGAVHHDGLVELMLGRAAVTRIQAPAPSAANARQPLLRLLNVSGGQLKGVDLELHPGEIVGVAGVTGSGREELADVIAGSLRFRGRIEVNGKSMRSRELRRTSSIGLGLVPSERRRHALFPGFTLQETITFGSVPGVPWYRSLRPSARRRDADTWIGKLGIVPPDPTAKITSLSGGNQQKAVFARVLRGRPTVMLLDEPTQGVDVGATAEIHALIVSAAADGCGVLVCSTEEDELARLCSRVYVLGNGVVSTQLVHPPLSAEEIAALAMRAERPAPSSIATDEDAGQAP